MSSPKSSKHLDAEKPDRILIAYVPVLSDGTEIHFQNYTIGTGAVSSTPGRLQLPPGCFIYTAPSIVHNTNTGQVHVQFCGKTGGATSPSWSLFHMVIDPNYQNLKWADVTTSTPTYPLAKQKLIPNLRSTPSVVCMGANDGLTYIATGTSSGSQPAVSMFAPSLLHPALDNGEPAWTVWPIKSSGETPYLMRGPAGVAHDESFSDQVYLATNTGGSLYIASCPLEDLQNTDEQADTDWPTKVVAQIAPDLSLGPMITPVVATSDKYHMLYLLFQTYGQRGILYSQRLSDSGIFVGEPILYGDSEGLQILLDLHVSDPNFFQDYGSGVAGVCSGDTIFMAYTVANKNYDDYLGIRLASMSIGHDGTLEGDTFTAVRVQAMSVKPAICIVPGDWFVD